MLGVIYVLKKLFLSFLCNDSINVFILTPLDPMADNNAFKRFAFSISRFEVVGGNGLSKRLTCGGCGDICSAERQKVTHTKVAF